METMFFCKLIKNEDVVPFFIIWFSMAQSVPFDQIDLVAQP